MSAHTRVGPVSGGQSFEVAIQSCDGTMVGGCALVLHIDKSYQEAAVPRGATIGGALSRSCSINNIRQSIVWSFGCFMIALEEISSSTVCM